MGKQFKDIKQYHSPIDNNIAVCIVYFNAGNYIRPFMNYLYTTNILHKSDIPTYTLELTYPGQIAALPDNDTILHVKSNSYMFHKENLLNILVSKLPDIFTKIVCLDCDVVFDDLNWINEVSTALDRLDVVVPYHDGCLLSSTYDSITSNAITITDTRYKTETEFFCAGYGIAMHRSFFNELGFYEYAILGGGDKMLLSPFMRRQLMINEFGSNKRSEYLSAISDMNLKYGFIPGTVYHMPHGELSSRQYLERHGLLSNLLIDTELTKNIDGVLEFKIPSKYNAIVLHYFKNRNEDYN